MEYGEAMKRPNAGGIKQPDAEKESNEVNEVMHQITQV